MAPNFEKYVQQAKKFIKEVAVELGIPEEFNKAFRILKSVLHALRSKISPQESLQLIAQLPMFIKAVYVDGWSWSGNRLKLRLLDEFLKAVKEEDHLTGEYDFGGSEETEKAVKAVFRVLKRHVSEGEILDITKTLPEELKPLFMD